MFKNLSALARRPSAPVPSLLKDDRGLSTVEYVILLVLIAAACVGIWSQFGATIKGKLEKSHTDIKEGLDQK